MTEIDRYALALTARLQAAVAEDYKAYQFHLVTQKLQGFCSEDLGGFYLDILKDRLYTCGADSRARRSAQTALWHIAQSLVRLMAPILSFTAEEAWQTLRRQRGKAASSRRSGTRFPTPALDQTVLDAWGDVRQFREIATKKIEEKREAQGDRFLAGGRTGHPGRTARRYESLARLGDDLRFVLITSRATVRKRARLRRAGQGQGKRAPEVRALLALPRRREPGRAVRALREQPARRGRAAALCLGRSRWFGLSAAVIVLGLPDQGRGAGAPSRRARAARWRRSSTWCWCSTRARRSASSPRAQGWQTLFFAAIAIVASVVISFLIVKHRQQAPVLRRPGADPGRRAGQPLRPRWSTGTWSISSISTPPAGTGRRSTSPIRRSRWARES